MMAMYLFNIPRGGCMVGPKEFVFPPKRLTKSSLRTRGNPGSWYRPPDFFIFVDQFLFFLFFWGVDSGVRAQTRIEYILFFV